jgi:hypothetical protein
MVGAQGRMKQKQNIRQKYQVTLTAEAKVTAGQVPMTDNGTGGDGIWWTVGLTRGSWDGAGYESFFPVLKYKSRPAKRVLVVRALAAVFQWTLTVS